MATLKDAIIKAPETGFCTIDRDLVLKYYDKYCFIIKELDTIKKENSYRLLRLKNKSKRFNSIKITISESDALYLIDVLNLKEIRSGIFRNQSSFYRADYNPA